jgi:hypothetical protein
VIVDPDRAAELLRSAAGQAQNTATYLASTTAADAGVVDARIEGVIATLREAQRAIFDTPDRPF